MKPAALRREVVGHARRIVDAFGETIGVLAPWGLATSRSAYVPASLTQHFSDQPVRWGDHSDEQAGSSVIHSLTTQPHLPTVHETDFLREWLQGGVLRPLVVIAPAGAGKTALLESFALQMARHALESRGSSTPEHPAAQFVPLVVPLAQALAAPSLTDYLLGGQDLVFGSLSGDVIRALVAERKLILLVDGFDENPAARERLTRDLRSLHIPFVLTSRPGYGAELVVDGPLQQITIAELTPKQCRSYIEGYFSAKKGSVDPDTLRARLPMLGQSPERPFHDWLTRPLYLKTWCEYVEEDPRHRAPESLGLLSHKLLRGFIARHNVVSTLSHLGDRNTRHDDDAIEQFAVWIGRLGHYFAQRGFGAQRFADTAGREMLEAAKSNGLLDAAFKCGLLMKINDSYYLPKVPLVESCTGYVLVADVVCHPKAPMLLIETFRSWIWQPQLHDILDYTFDALWHAKSIPERQWASELLKWAINADTDDEAHRLPLVPWGERDVTRPFSAAALRWYALNPDQRTEDQSEIARAAKTLARTWLAQEATHGDKERMLPNVSLSYGMARLILEAFGATQLEDAERWWEICAPAVESIALLIKRSDAVQLVEEAVRLSALCEGKGNMAQVWYRASEIAARRVSREDAAAACRKWTARAKRPGTLDFRAAWLVAAQRCAESLSEDEALPVLRDALHEADETGLGFGWIALAITAASRLASNDASRAIEMLTFKLRGAKADDEQDMWGCAIREAAGRLPPNESYQAIKKWVEAYGQAKASELRKAYLAAAHGAALRMKPDDAHSVLRTCLELLASTSCGPEQWDISQMMRTVSECVREDQAVGILDLLLREKNPDCDGAVAAVSRRVPPDRAEQVIRRSIGYHDRALQEGDIGSALQFVQAIEGAASRLNAGAAGEIIEELIEQYRRCERTTGHSDFESFLWLKSVANAASRIEATAAARLAHTWIDTYRSATSARDKRESARIIETVATNLSPSDAVTVCEFCLDNSLVGSARNLASAKRVAILSAAPSSPSPTYRAVEQTNPVDEMLKLDPSMATAPDAVRKALFGAPNLSFVQSKLLSALARQWELSRARKVENEAWLTWSPWAEQAHLGRQHIKPPEQDALVRPLLDHGLIESARPGKTILKYRITPDGRAFERSLRGTGLSD